MGVAGFFFLRFVCPSLVAPEQLGLALSPPPDARRALVLIAKVLQNAASGVVFKKEVFMYPLNDFVQSAAQRLTTLYDFLSAEVSEGVSMQKAGSESVLGGSPDVTADMHVVHRYVHAALF